MNTLAYVLYALLLLLVMCKTRIEGMIAKKNLKKVCDDGYCFKVVKDFDQDTHEKAAERLAYANGFMINFLRFLRDKYLFNRLNGNTYRQQMVHRMLENYSPHSLIENNPVDDVNTSYVENKGRVFAVCLREKIGGSQKFHDNNILEFVLIHEMAHLASEGYGHGYEFWANFKILLQEAKEAGIHTPVDYKKIPHNYCSLEVDYNPYFDTSLITP